MEEYNVFYRLVFNFHKKYAPCPVDLAGWEAMSAEAAEISYANGNHPFLQAMLCSAYEEMTRRYKQK